MRRLVLLVSALVFADTLLYAALTPLLPQFTHELGLSKTLAGVLVGAYPLGALLGGVPGGFAAARLGSKRAVLSGLALFAIASVVFALAHGFLPLFVARTVQGAGSALTWAGAFTWLITAAPRERRGQLVGNAMGAAVFGALLGPALGAAAALVGRGIVFSMVAALGGVLGVVAWLQPNAPGGQRPSVAAVVEAGRNRRFLGGLALMCLPALLFGVLAVLAPLHLSAAGWGAAAIGGVWIGGAALEGIQNPLVGRLSDRRGRLLPVRVALAGGVAVSLLLALGGRPLYYVPLVVLANMAYGTLLTPGIALIADGAEDTGLAQGLAFGIMNAAWAMGAVTGPVAAGTIAEASGDSVPFLISAGLCVAGLLAARRGRSDHEAAALVERLSGDAARVGQQ